MKNQINPYFEERIAACKDAAAALNADNRSDEAVFEKIRMNVFSIFHSVYAAGEKVSGGDEGKQLEFLRDRLQRIPSGWETALDVALSHGNSEQAHIERIKLEAVAELRQKLAE